MKLVKNYERESIRISADKATAFVTVNGGHVTAEFDVNGKKIEPFYVAPWYKDYAEGMDTCCDYALRGTFFGFPFGMTSKEIDGVERPCHGFFPCRNHDLEQGEGKTAVTSLVLPEEKNAKITQKVEVKDGQTVLYFTNTVENAFGKYPVGYHPTVKTPTELGSAILDMSPYKLCLTSPTHIDDPAKGGYCSLPLDYEIKDVHNVPTVYGKNADLTRLPFIKGFDDIYMYVFDDSEKFNWAALSVPEEGYLYFQIKNPKQLSNSMIWTSFKGRHYSYWAGRVDGCIEIGAATNYFFYGLDAARGTDPLTEKGFTMSHEFDGTPKEYKLIAGVAAIPADYKGVEKIERKDAHTIAITGKDGSLIETACDIDFIL